ncbi:39S ribosomal protein S30, mitochondrial [Diorhabda sublineata]|uniref:39S ribosomal protein S30, mitochondrial n=1 Tax=Diorhabda sublineata TaxID=1163346 RepID=UPI0024E15F9B|nr:39S ribosomal protein S30, mitochondrial [Diorhabda sublineata]
MSVIRINRSVLQHLLGCRYSSTVIRHEEEYTATPNYPPILDISYKKTRERKTDALYEEIKAVKTVEEKQIKLNMPRYYGYKSYLLYEDKCDYNNLALTQHVTRTHLITNETLPEFYSGINVDEVTNKLKAKIEEAVSIEIDGYQRLHDIRNEDITEAQIEDIISNSFCKQINRIIVNELYTNYSHLKEAQIDWNPRIESSWFVGGMNIPDYIRKSREGSEWRKQFLDDPFDRLMFYIGSPNLALRSKLPLKPIIPHSDSENPDLKVPEFKFDPRVVGITSEQKHIANIPGFWPGDPHKFSLLSFHKRGHIHRNEKYNDPQDNKEAIHRQGILASFGWLQAQANYLGFNTFNDLTYPLVTQTIVTSGKIWSFYAYQLNTIRFCERFYTENPKRNICWALPEMKLFETVENGKVVGFNDEVVKNILKFYMNPPENRLGVNLTPYLSSEEKLSADYKDDEKRQWIEEVYKYVASNRPRHRLSYEVYDWEKIYKIDNKTRFMDKRLRPFELFQNPYRRKLNERFIRYIPRKFREHLKRYQGRFEKDFWP